MRGHGDERSPSSFGVEVSSMEHSKLPNFRIAGGVIEKIHMIMLEFISCIISAIQLFTSSRSLNTGSLRVVSVFVQSQ